jgi:archaeal type IV pilus assembly protein PilA
LKFFNLKRTLRGNLKAVSPVIATIIIVAIAITMSIAVAYWLLGLGSSFTRYEKVEFSSAFVTGDATNGYTVYMVLKNTGSAAATIDQTAILYNGKPANVTGGAGVVISTFVPATLEPGMSTTTAQLQLPTSYVAGTTLEITLHTTGGKDYPKVVTLP